MVGEIKVINLSANTERKMLKTKQKKNIHLLKVIHWGETSLWKASYPTLDCSLECFQMQNELPDYGFIVN